jgi:hypothetical protein
VAQALLSHAPLLGILSPGVDAEKFPSKQGKSRIPDEGIREVG